MRQAEETDIKSFKHLSYHYAIDCTGVIYEALDIREKGAHLKGKIQEKLAWFFYQILVYLVKHHNMGHLDGDH